MSDREPLLAAVLAQPAEDTPRLMYADWLDEHGDDVDRARAEFIRLQCAARAPDGTRLSAGTRREFDLLETHGHEWLGRPDSIEDRPLVQDDYDMTFIFRHEPDLLGVVAVTFRRGFADTVTCSAWWWSRHADRLLAEHPIHAVDLLGHVWLDDKVEEFRRAWPTVTFEPGW